MKAEEVVTPKRQTQEVTPAPGVSSEKLPTGPGTGRARVDHNRLAERGGVQWPLPAEVPDGRTERRLFEDGKFYHADGRASDDRWLVRKDGSPFWASGLLSSFLDNAPTYLVFFNTAGGDAKVLMTQLAPVLSS